MDCFVVYHKVQQKYSHIKQNIHLKKLLVVTIYQIMNRISCKLSKKVQIAVSYE